MASVVDGASVDGLENLPLLRSPFLNPFFGLNLLAGASVSSGASVVFLKLILTI